MQIHLSRLKLLILSMIMLLSTSIFSQIEFMDDHVEIIYYEGQLDHHYFGIRSLVDTTFSFNWELVIADSIEEVINLSMYDINIHYNSDIRTSCDIPVINTLEAYAEDSIFFDLYISDIEDVISFDSPTLQLNLLSYPDCDTLLSTIPVSIVDQSLNVHNLDYDNIHLFPNPASQYLKFDGLHSTKIDFTIYNIQGMQVKHGRLTDNQINLLNLPEGIYMVQIYSEEFYRNFKFLKIE